MRKLILGALFVTVAAVSYGQGTATVTFDNRTATLTSPPDRLIRYDSSVSSDPSINPFGGTNNTVVNFGTHTYVAQLYFGATSDGEGSLQAVTTAPAAFRASNTANPGTWLNGTRTLGSFTAGTAVNLQVRIWEPAFGSDYFSVNGGLRGKSLIFTYTCPTDPLAPPSAFTMASFSGFVLTAVPEPTTLALAGLGAAALLIFRRRK